MILDLLCEKCWYNEYDEETDECFCSLVLDEDEYVAFAKSRIKPAAISDRVVLNMILYASKTK